MGFTNFLGEAGGGWGAEGMRYGGGLVSAKRGSINPLRSRKISDLVSEIVKNVFNCYDL